MMNKYDGSWSTYEFVFEEETPELTDYQDSVNRSNYIIQEIEGLRKQYKQAYAGFGIIEQLIRELPQIEYLLSNKEELEGIKGNAYQAASLLAESQLTIQGIYGFIAVLLNKNVINRLENYKTISEMLKMKELVQAFDTSIKVMNQLVSGQVPLRLSSAEVSYSLYKKLWDLGFNSSKVLLSPEEYKDSPAKTLVEGFTYKLLIAYYSFLGIHNSLAVLTTQLNKAHDVPELNRWLKTHTPS
jgi:hypothetical protein